MTNFKGNDASAPGKLARTLNTRVVRTSYLKSAIYFIVAMAIAVLGYWLLYSLNSGAGR